MDYDDYIPDPIELGESRAERAYDEMIQPGGRLKCGCGALFTENEAQMISPDPYSMPVCPKCAEEAFSK